MFKSKPAIVLLFRADGGGVVGGGGRGGVGGEFRMVTTKMLQNNEDLCTV